MAVWSPFWPPNPLEKLMWVHFCVLSQEMRHVNGAVWGVGVYVERYFVLVLSLIFRGP